MIIESNDPPNLKDSFLKGIGAAFRRRRKAISYQGNLKFSYDPTDSFERLTISFLSFNDPTLILELAQGGWMSFFVRSNKRADRGKVLVRIEDLRVVHNAALIVSTFEWTISHSRIDDNDDLSLWQEIEERWKKLSMKIVK